MTEQDLQQIKKTLTTVGYPELASTVDRLYMKYHMANARNEAYERALDSPVTVNVYVNGEKDEAEPSAIPDTVDPELFLDERLKSKYRNLADEGQKASTS